MDFVSSPYLHKPASVQRVMLTTLGALLPGIAAYVWWFGPAIVVTLAIASLTALAAEALLLALRGKPAGMFLTDGSALLTAWLLALCLPPIAPWWLIAVATLFAIVIAKHLYGGLGQNPFNPAMVGFAVSIVSFPALMAQWPGTGGDLATQLGAIFGTQPRLDGLTSATALDQLKTSLRMTEGATPVSALLADAKVFGLVAGRGWEWVAGGYLVGGIALLAMRIITWHVPAAFLGTLLVVSGALWAWMPEAHPSPLFHLFGGATMLAAFFIATDPVSGATTPRGKLIFGAGAALLTILIRVFGGYPDGVAFAVLLMNLCVPLIDMWTQPAIFGMKDKTPGGRA